MPPDHLTQSVRQRVTDLFAEHQSAQPADRLCESILIRDGYYCGRRFGNGEMEAVWFLEENELKLYASDGSLVEVVVAVPQETALPRRVA